MARWCHTAGQVFFRPGAAAYFGAFVPAAVGSDFGSLGFVDCPGIVMSGAGVAFFGIFGSIDVMRHSVPSRRSFTISLPGSRHFGVFHRIVEGDGLPFDVRVVVHDLVALYGAGG
ncbi:MAG: hypothetical protein IPF53_16895 [Blastocatellia bacterium]|nr:hypothetical protein [Blastocatellia bacterium]